MFLLNSETENSDGFDEVVQHDHGNCIHQVKTVEAAAEEANEEVIIEQTERNDDLSGNHCTDNSELAGTGDTNEAVQSLGNSIIIDEDEYDRPRSGELGKNPLFSNEHPHNDNDSFLNDNDGDVDE